MRKLIMIPVLCFAQIVMAQTIKNVGDFSVVRAYDKISVELVPSSDSKVEILSSNDGDVELLNKNGELKIRMVTTKLLQGDNTKVKVYFSQLKEVQGSQGAIISASQAIKSNRLALISNEGSLLDLHIDVANLDVKANSGGQMKLSGSADRQEAVVNSGAQYYAKNLQSDDAVVTANAGGVIEVNASESVVAKTRAGGEIVIYGNPKDKDTKKIMGGTIRFK